MDVCSSFFSTRQTFFRKRRRCSFLRLSGAYLRALPILVLQSVKTKCKALINSRGCFGCCIKPTPSAVEVDEPSKGLKIQGRVVNKAGISDDFWSTSTCEMDNSTMQSQQSVSSISASNLPLDPQSGMNNSTEFVNHGLLLWNQTRQQWLASKTSHKQPKAREPAISWNATYESLLSTNKPFPRPIPLQEMVDFLVDVWEQEGLYD